MILKTRKITTLQQLKDIKHNFKSLCREQAVIQLLVSPITKSFSKKLVLEYFRYPIAFPLKKMINKIYSHLKAKINSLK